MKIGIMTWHHFYNYGTALQLYAMSTVLKKMGHEPFIINYHAKDIGLAGEKKSIVKKIIYKADINIYRSYQPEERSKLFKDFFKKHLVYTEPCDTLPELERLNDFIDAFVCGSDQIWSPIGFDPHYYLDFVGDKKRTIAYAPSVGTISINNDYVKRGIKENASKIAHLSTREKTGSELISQLTGRKVETVLDPTLLLSAQEWREAANTDEISSKPYLLVYLLGHNENHWKQVYQIAEANELEVKIVPVFYNDFKRKGCLKELVGPEEFLRLVDHASMVCTDSFHGTLFSIQFRKEFVVFERFKKNSAINQNSRIYEILGKLDLTDRIICVSNDWRKAMSNHINYEEVEIRLNKERVLSNQFFTESLNSVEKHITSIDKQKINIKYNLSLCCGCGVCAAVCPTNAITISLDHEGFYTSSVIEDKCISCGKCRKVCPYISGLKSRPVDQGKLYSYKDTSNEVLLKSSSGGAAFALSRLAIKQGYLVAGSTYSRSSHAAEHIIVNDENGLKLLQGSKYMQSKFSAISGELLKKGKVVIFGTPCQIAGAKQLCANEDNVYVDLICHGVPSAFLYQSYMDYLSRKNGINPEKVETIFRYKPRGWRERYIYSTDSEKEVCNHQSSDPYFLAFEHGVCYSRNCFECPWRDKSQADIRIGDYWNPKYNNDKTGVSMVLALTEKGDKWLRGINEYGRVEDADIVDYTSVQQMTNFAEPLFRKDIIKRLSDGDPLKTIVDEYVMPLEKTRRIIRKLDPIKKAIKKVIRRHE